MFINHFLDKSNKILLETIRRDILKRLKKKGVDLKKINVNLKDEKNCIRVSVCLDKGFCEKSRGKEEQTFARVANQF